MTRTRACLILGITADAGMSEIKKAYRKLMHQVHPDTDAFHTIKYAYTAQEINEAYGFLCKVGTAQTKQDSSKAASPQQTSFTRRSDSRTRWNAPLNPNAYTERNIYHYVEDYDCSIIGNIILDTGKFLWQPEEDFPLFLKSIFECGKKILEKAEQESGHTLSSSRRAEIQPKLVYLLAQQFIDATETLKMLIKPSVKEDCNIYHIPAMLELSLNAPVLPAGSVLYPAAIQNHRLFLKLKNGQTIGYLSFHDDRLYYIVIPLFEQRRAQVKIRISDKTEQKKSRNSSLYKNLDFWLKVPHISNGTFPENISLQLEQLLGTMFVA